MFKVILAATDGSGHGTRAAEVAAGIAVKFNAKLVLLSVAAPASLPAAILEASHSERASSPHPLIARVPGWFDDALDTIRNATGETRVFADKFADEALNHGEEAAKSAGLAEPERLLKEGDPARATLDSAEQEAADLIVLGRRGLGHIAEPTMGSVSLKVSQLAERCCLTVN